MVSRLENEAMIYRLEEGYSVIRHLPLYLASFI